MHLLSRVSLMNNFGKWHITSSVICLMRAKGLHFRGPIKNSAEPRARQIFSGRQINFKSANAILYTTKVLIGRSKKFSFLVSLGIGLLMIAYHFLVVTPFPIDNSLIPSRHYRLNAYNGSLQKFYLRL